MVIFYRLGSGLYVNITNVCPCHCIFCIRNTTHTVGDAPTLWLSQEPTVSEIKAAFKTRTDLDEVTEVVFCGYGEPMVRAADIIEICHFIKQESNLPIRINTNGLVSLLHPNFALEALTCVNHISVSLNADTPEEYLRIVNPQFGIKSFQAVLDFATQAKKYTHVTFTVMEDLGEARIANCYKIAQALNIPLRVRQYM